MLTLSEFIRNFAAQYSVQHINDVDHGVFMEEIKPDIYLLNNCQITGDE